jgi:dolichol-phosphate mannosyltransferase
MAQVLHRVMAATQYGASDMTRKPLLSLVTPAYNEAEGIQAFHARALAVMESLDGLDYEMIYVDDGSRDDSFKIMSEFAATNPRVKVVKFSRNFGHQIAITAGLDHACGDAIVFIDADLQDPPELIHEMVTKWRDGFDVVYAKRARREGETRFKLWTAAMFYRLLRSLSNIDIPQDVGDFRLISARVANELRAMREKDRFIRGLVSWVGFPQTFVLYDRDERFAGETKYPLKKMLKFAFDGITSFSNTPLKVATWMGYGASALAFLYLASVFVQWAFGITVEGWATMMVAMLFLGGVQLICIGILGEYLGRIFNEIKPRPVYIVQEVASSAETATTDLDTAAPLAAFAEHGRR